MERTLGHKTLDLEAEAFPVSRECYSKLDSLIEAADSAIYCSDEPISILSRIHSFLRKSGIKTMPDSEYLFSKCLEKGEFDCRVSLLYRAIGDALGLPLKTVTAPRHIFIRWEDRERRLNWETTTAKHRLDEGYAAAYNIPASSIRLGVYLKSLSSDEETAVAAMQIGAELKAKGQSGLALEYFTRATGIYPAYSEAWHNRGAACCESKSFQESILCYSRAIELNGNFAHAYLNRGLVHDRLGNMPAAAGDFTKAARLNPEYLAKIPYCYLERMLVE